MKKISSGMTAFTKKVFPTLWFGFLAVFFLIAISSGAAEAGAGFIFIPVVMAVFGFFLMKQLVWDLVGEVPAGFSLSPFATNPIAEDLIVRVDDARSRRT